MESLNKIMFSKLREGAKIPNKLEENAGMDIYPCFDEPYLLIKPLETKLVPTGLASAFSSDYYIQIQERGSTGSKGIKYGAGVIDSGYRGEWFIAITNCNNVPIIISKLDNDELFKRYDKEIFNKLDSNFSAFIFYPYEKAIAQAIIHKVHNLPIKEISYEELKTIPSLRGEGKLGSSGK